MQAAKLRQQSLQDRLEECLKELKKVCIREAELTGHLSSDYPLLPGEEPPNIRRRVGTAFRLDEESILQGDEHPELGPLEAELALQLQIYEAARGLCQEEHRSKAVRRSRLQQCRAAERRVKELQESAFQLRLRLGRGSPRPTASPVRSLPASGRQAQSHLGPSDDTSLSDSALQDEDEAPSQGSDRSRESSPVPDPLPPAPGTPQTPLFPPLFPPLQALGELRPSYSPSVDYDLPPIQNSPWTESSLDEPYQKQKKKSRSSYSSQASTPTPMSTPMSTPVSTPVDPQFGSSAHPLQFTPIRTVELRPAQCNSAPCTPELQLRRQQSQSFRLPSRELPHEPDLRQGRPRMARRRIVEFGVMPGDCGPLVVGMSNALYQSGSEDSCSEHSAPSYTSSPCSDLPGNTPHLSPYGYSYPGPHGHPLAYAGPHGPPVAYRPPLDFPGPHGGPLAYTGPSFYKNPMHQSSPSFYRGYVEEDLGFPPEMDVGRLYLGPHPGPPGRYECWYEDAPPAPPRLAARPPAPHARLSRAPSLRGPAPPRPHGDRVPEGLALWQQRGQQREPRPRSLDRKGAVRLRSVQERESPLAFPHRQQRRPPPQQRYLEQVPQKAGLRSPADGTPAQWFLHEDAEIASQV
ncbi:hypothetical protein COCON_G00173170 [Conger conger]|uniref:Cytohesin Ubiquitin Protein Inducing domain-containing protein n=1 Tax=Conger conger TaxID=82655 RepID=A0A9Q1D412_CONCO|nr:hypothetical protein COCON_G00173170 [Conger conger]